ncbi:MBL fold metallo-hydrolase [Sphingomonas sp. Leaf407]|uniref:MBL fold metallo-hydrolase n=1 Tax=unclassified Sphingomonas TaxID=196159 RepID=UPI0006FD70D0|nr:MULTISPECIES: MBL fold metallo-hydrolase [unclassified Sphingomonas]KQN40876.1 MBL fold metallo-hydrolase [Sphingomonas sp. Leaf42]KQT30788.1 MBL fold metallo-hydrolase [Sphingomonas sp. Leaf407]
MIHVCATCGTSYASGAIPPGGCAICNDERQYVPPTGQRWTTREAIAARHLNSWRQHAPDLFSIVTTPRFAIGQRAFLITTPAGNILWDCIANLDAATRTLVEALGGIRAIALSHPHYYTTMQDWSDAFGAPILVHADDRRWLMRNHGAVRFWEGDSFDMMPAIRLIRLGGHFPGGAVLHWEKDNGSLFVGDILQIAPGADRLSFMWSYPNMLPLPASVVAAMARQIDRYGFDRMFGAFEGQDIWSGAKSIALTSAKKYISHLAED